MEQGRARICERCAHQWQAVIDNADEICPECEHDVNRILRVTCPHCDATYFSYTRRGACDVCGLPSEPVRCGRCARPLSPEWVCQSCNRDYKVSADAG